jgi:ABC-type branched-subunit amino acid transport system substrate-binding protein
LRAQTVRRFRLRHAFFCLAWLLLAPLLLSACAQQRVAPEPSPGPAPSRTVEPARAPVSAEPIQPEPGATAPPAPAEPAANLVPPGVAEPVLVALLLPLSGPHASLGQSLLDAASLAMAELAGPNLVLLPRDTGGTGDGARRAAEAALQQGARLILGPVFRDAVQGAAEPARARGVPVVAFSTDRSVAGNGVYLLGFTPGQQVERVVKFAADKGMRRFAVLAPSSPYGYAVVQELQATIGTYGLQLASVQFYGADGEGAEAAVKAIGEYEARRVRLKRRRAELAGIGDAEARRALRRLANADTYGELPFDALLLPEGGQVLRQVAPLLPYYDIDGVRLLGTGLWDDPTLAREPSLAGGWYAAPSPAVAGDFQRRYKTAYGVEPPRIASLAYDATALAVVLAQSGNRFDVSILNAASGFAGSDGIFRFRPDGVAERGLAVLEIGRDGVKVVDPAPLTFEAQPRTKPGS